MLPCEWRRQEVLHSGVYEYQVSTKSDIGRSDLEIAREHLIRARLYGTMSMSFVAVGFIIFFIFYERYVGGDASAFFKKPVLFATVFLPFLPAYIFALLAIKRRKAVLQVLYGAGDSQHKSGQNKSEKGDASKKG